ncbi:transmembrane protein, putative (macronuclear) [Tetrahymena thermophila SB210]|uniref:Transmembrane protein, putative n=1 Tax=Tetrahymena thermophila (strain SB210) TaxID=312017 RepID=Q236L5_TETTS|nr:transmembrane protein, putative [Tetrahymena thermophila SB210]EAR92485.2 transmembrane protein, putative [Tetrahymena thermophila SB210]|eukprot:XP_001012730.2 transmembrane protein, putative [Tetrahymena thermophila SB210]
MQFVFCFIKEYRINLIQLRQQYLFEKLNNPNLFKEMGQYLPKQQDTQNEYYNDLKKFTNSNYSGNQKLKLEFMDLSDKDASNLAQALRQCISIVELDLLVYHTRINKNIQNEIVEAIQNCKKMQTLRIKFELLGPPIKNRRRNHSNNYGERERERELEQMIVLGNNIREFKDLQNLLIWNDIIFGTETAISLINGISECTNLSSLNMKLIFDSLFNENDAIFSQLGKLENLKILKLFIQSNQDNLIEGFPLIHKYLEQIKHLEQIDFCLKSQRRVQICQILESHLENAQTQNIQHQFYYMIILITKVLAILHMNQLKFNIYLFQISQWDKKLDHNYLQKKTLLGKIKDQLNQILSQFDCNVQINYFVIYNNQCISVNRFLNSPQFLCIPQFIIFIFYDQLLSSCFYFYQFIIFKKYYF